MEDHYRRDQVQRVADAMGDRDRASLAVRTLAGKAVDSKWITLNRHEVEALARALDAEDNPDPEVKHLFPVVDLTVATTRLPITSGEHVRRLAEMAERVRGLIIPEADTPRPSGGKAIDLPALSAWWSYCAGETDERPS